MRAQDCVRVRVRVLYADKLPQKGGRENVIFFIFYFFFLMLWGFHHYLFCVVMQKTIQH